VNARICVTGSDVVDELASLWKWLRAEPDLRGYLRVVAEFTGDLTAGRVCGGSGFGCPVSWAGVS
jgi:hypothetical protein